MNFVFTRVKSCYDWIADVECCKFDILFLEVDQMVSELYPVGIKTNSNFGTIWTFMSFLEKNNSKHFDTNVLILQSDKSSQMLQFWYNFLNLYSVSQTTSILRDLDERVELQISLASECKHFLPLFRGIKRVFRPKVSENVTGAIIQEILAIWITPCTQYNSLSYPNPNSIRNCYFMLFSLCSLDSRSQSRCKNHWNWVSGGEIMPIRSGRACVSLQIFTVIHL